MEDLEGNESEPAEAGSGDGSGDEVGKNNNGKFFPSSIFMDGRMVLLKHILIIFII